jgi:photosystem II stability/assembly factor-like uncharacterized protein
MLKIHIARAALILVFSVATVVIGAGTASAGINGGTSVGPEGGFVGSLVVDTHNPQTLYAGTYAGVFKSIDGGTSWNNAGLGGSFVSNLAIDSQNPGTIYATAAVSTVGVFKSSDGGENWHEVDAGLPLDCAVNAFAVHPQSPGTLFAATSCRGVFKSTNGGESWKAVNSGLPPTTAVPGGAVTGVRALAIDPENPSILYLVAFRCDPKIPNPGCDSRVFKTTNEAENWNEATSSTLSENIIYSLVVDPQNASTLYARVFGPGLQNGVFRSTDGGKTWTLTTVDLFFLTIDPQGAIYAAGSVLFKSADGGTTWSALSFSGAISALVFDPQKPNSMYAADFSGVYKSTDGGASWSGPSSGMRAIGVLSLAIDPQSPDTLYAGTGLALFKSMDRGKNWTANSSWKPAYNAPVTIAVDPKNSSKLYAAAVADEGYCAGLFGSGDAGMSWANIGLIGCISAVVVDPQNPDTVYVAMLSAGVVKINSLDGGQSWAGINSGLAGDAVTTLAVDPQNPQTLYAGVQSRAGLPGFDTTLFKTTDGGMTWNPTALTVAKSIVSAVRIDSQNSNSVYAVTATSPNTPGGLWKSVDGGASWRDLSASLPFPVYTVAVNPKNPTTIYAGTDFAVMTSMDAGETWIPLSSIIGPARLLTLDPKNPSTLYAAGPGGLLEISTSASLNVTSIGFDVSVVRIGATFNATMAGPNDTGQVYFDVQVRPPGSVTDIVILNWQTGTSASHSVSTGTVTGTWTITGVRAHEIETDHTGSFFPVSATLTVAP